MKTVKSSKPVLNYNVVPMTSGLLLIFDFFGLLLLLTVFFAISQNNHWLTLQTFSFNSASNFAHAALIAVVPAPFFLYDKHFGAIISRGTLASLLRSHFLRFMLFSGFVLLLGSLVPASDRIPAKAILIWGVVALTLTSLTRLLMALPATWSLNRSHCHRRSGYGGRPFGRGTATQPR